MEETSSKIPSVCQVTEILRAKILKYIYRINTQLPSDLELRKALEVICQTIRLAMDLFVVRILTFKRQRVGLFVSYASEISMPLYQFIDIYEMLYAQVSVPELVDSSVFIAKADSQITKLLQIKLASTILEPHKCFTANNDAVVYLVNHIPM